MNTAELVAVLTSRSDLPPAAVLAVVRTLAVILEEAMVVGEPIEIAGIGSWSRDWHQGGTPPVFRVRFRTDASLRQRVAEVPNTRTDPRHQRAWRLSRTLVGDLVLYHPHVVPRLGSQESAEDVNRSCRAAFGTVWDQVRNRYNTDIPEALRDEVDHLTFEAQRRWGHDEEGSR